MKDHTLEEWARLIVACDPDSDRPRTVDMMQLLIDITGVTVREAYRAIKGALDA